MEKKSGISFDQAQVSLVRKWLGHKHTTGADVPHSIEVKAPVAARNNMSLSPEQHHFYSPLTKTLELPSSPDNLSVNGAPELNRTSSEGGKTTPQQSQRVVVPTTYDEAAGNIERFESATPRNDDMVADTVGQHAQLDSTALSAEQWMGTQQEEMEAYVSPLPLVFKCQI